MSVLTDVLMEALDNKEITPAEASVMMRQYYTEGVIKNAIDNAYRVMDTPRKDRATVIEQIKSNSALKDAEKNVRKYCAMAYKTMLKYSRVIGIKDNENGKDDMQNVINGINAAVKKYHNAERIAEKSDKSQVDAVAKKVIGYLNSAKKCFASDGTPNRDALKKLAENTRLEYHNLGVSDVDAKAPKPKDKEKAKASKAKPVKESFDDDFFSEGFFSDMKSKMAKKNDSNSSKATTSSSNSDKKLKIDPKQDAVDKAVSKCQLARTGASGAMSNKIKALKNSDKYTSNSDIKDSNKSMNYFASMISDAIDNVKSFPAGKSAVAPLTKVINCIKKAISSNDPKDIENYRMMMLDQKLVVSESYQLEAVNLMSTKSMMTALTSADPMIAEYNKYVTSWENHVRAGDALAAKEDLKNMRKGLKTMRDLIDKARNDTGIIPVTAINILFYALIIMTITAGCFVGNHISPILGGAIVGPNALAGFEMTRKAIGGVMNTYTKTGKINPAAFNVALGYVSKTFDDMATQIYLMEKETKMIQ